jgi:methionyl-tRNA formyltransferase
MDLVFMGTAPFAVPALRAIVEAGHTVGAVVTQPDRPRGRGMKLQPSAVKAAALELGLPVLQPDKASQPEYIDALRSLAPRVIVVVAYGQILRPVVLDIPPLGCINVHGSLLPKLRGAGPIQWAIIRGCTETGVTTMFMDPGMDTGDMFLKASLPVRAEATALTLGEQMAPLGAALLVETLQRVEAGTAPREPQDHDRATYAPLLKKEDGALSWDRPAVELRNRIHGCNPSPGAYARRGEESVKIWRAEALPEPPGAPPGTVLDAESLVIAAGEGRLRLLEVQPESRGRLDAAAYARGYRVTPGERWGNG